MSGHTTAAPLAYSSPPYPSPGCVDGQHQVVGAQAVALSVRVAEDACLQELVVAVRNAWNGGRGRGGEEADEGVL